MSLMHVQLQTEFWICHIRKFYNAKKNLIVMHDDTFSDHMRVSMWKFMNSGTENVLYGIWINGHVSVL